MIPEIRLYLCGDKKLNNEDGKATERNEECPSKELCLNEEDDQTYLNVLQSAPHADARTLLIAQCEILLEKFERNENGSDLVGENTDLDTEPPKADVDEEESSYLDMSGTLKANTSSSDVSIGDTKDETSADTSEPKTSDDCRPFEVCEENSYDLTTDQILYDECCQQEVSYEQEPPSTPPAPAPDSPLDEHQCPYGGLPASHLRLQQAPKHGTLFKQEKRLFFDQFKKYYVGLIGKWLLLYNSHNDLKPWQTIFIKSIKLDLNLNEQINEKHLFQIITHTDSKVHFLSPSFQDLNEWIVAIENNLIEKVDRAEETVAPQGQPRKLPLPPCPTVIADSEDQTDLHTARHVEDGIYEEPTLCLQTDSATKAKTHGYDTPKPCAVKPSDTAVTTNAKKPDLPPKIGDSPPTPAKSWLKNRFNRSPPDPIEGKVSKKALKKLSFEELASTPESVGEPKFTAKQQSMLPPSPKFSLTTTASSKGTKINMIISQLEANGQLNLLSKRLNETNKRYTWVADGVPG
uniref:PH domain-containing protein n=1 Tax=Anopheles dirus TaxID=7168 RepID=A0A182N541_9DIPT